MIPVLNRFALGLKTISKPIASGLNHKFQQSLVRMAQRKQAEKMVKVDRVDKEESSVLALPLTIVGFPFAYEYYQRIEQHKDLMAILAGCQGKGRK
ncbi:hypothetical protein A4A49_13874 [Nicotiana attenuata]|uniref:Uncharacterized protein n=1 Tax=Nicotiana attenuata TaxID=49451 RepID=A0A314KM24_NICAT|nr:hypothetical protein A4A49_13874 [Nicotiana attenuata]